VPTPTIKAEAVGKRYRLGQTINRSDLLSEAISAAAVRPFRRLTGRGNGAVAEHERDFWALRDVSLEVEDGEVLGVIGRNGAGKTTLLKILSRITEPTEGTIDLYGRVGSLLEVGTGFHPELTGRENVYLNGAILGMTRAEITRKFDEIVAFAEVEQFLDTPVKRYSSGMYVRLAFAVAAHLEPEILIVDEVLAVGDVAFQRKCLGKMEDVGREGRTVLFVSHNMAAVSNLCSRAILLEEGRVLEEGSTDAVIGRYLQLSDAEGSVSLRERPDRQGSGALRIERIAFHDAAGGEIPSVAVGAPLTIELDYVSPGGSPHRNVVVALGFDTLLGQRVTKLDSQVAGKELDELPPAGTIRCTIPAVPFNAGRYHVTVFVSVGGTIADWVRKAVSLDVVASDFFGSGRSLGTQDGIVVVPHAWEVDREAVVGRP
jgi:lipopolysaccharide transport system ATP-binding protein